MDILKEATTLKMATIQDDGINDDLPLKSGPSLTVVIGGCNSIHAHNVVQVSGETLTAIANTLQVLPPESINEIIEPLTDLLRSTAAAVSRVSKG